MIDRWSKVRFVDKNGLVYTRLLTPPEGKSFFLFGPRGTGKSSWVRATFPKALFVDLLESRNWVELQADPGRLEGRIPPGHKDWVVIDEVQRVPAVLDEVHRLIESRRLKFILTGSSARKLRRGGANLLAGRALTLAMHPLTATETGKDFSLQRALRHGQLPAVYSEKEPERFLSAYVQTYLREEVQQEGLVRNLAAFTRFLEVAAFSQASVLNISNVAREAAVNRKVAEDYFAVTEDLLIATRLTPFTRRAKRESIVHPKFFFFDAGVFRSLRPRGPLDSENELRGPAAETLVLQELRAINDGLGFGYSIHFWQPRQGREVDFVLYGPRGLLAIEVKTSSMVRPADLEGLKLFGEDYPQSRRLLFHGGRARRHEDGIELVPLGEGLERLPEFLRADQPRK